MCPKSGDSGRSQRRPKLNPFCGPNFASKSQTRFGRRWWRGIIGVKIKGGRRDKRGPEGGSGAHYILPNRVRRENRAPALRQTRAGRVPRAGRRPLRAYCVEAPELRGTWVRTAAGRAPSGTEPGTRRTGASGGRPTKSNGKFSFTAQLGGFFGADLRRWKLPTACFCEGPRSAHLPCLVQWWPGYKTSQLAFCALEKYHAFCHARRAEVG